MSERNGQDITPTTMVRENPLNVNKARVDQPQFYHCHFCGITYKTINKTRSMTLFFTSYGSPPTWPMSFTKGPLGSSGSTLFSPFSIRPRRRPSARRYKASCCRKTESKPGARAQWAHHGIDDWWPRFMCIRPFIMGIPGIFQFGSRFFSRVGHWWLSGTHPVDTIVGCLFQLNFHPSKAIQAIQPAMALCCRLSNFFRAESVNFSQVFSSRTRYLTTETWNAAGWLQREGDQRSLNGNSMGTLNTGHSCDWILENQTLKAPSQRFFWGIQFCSRCIGFTIIAASEPFDSLSGPQAKRRPSTWHHPLPPRRSMRSSWELILLPKTSCIAIKTISPINQNVYLPLEITGG